jgi:hypothetical protein
MKMLFGALGLLVLAAVPSFARDTRAMTKQQVITESPAALHANLFLPNVPGVVNRAVTQENIGRTICVKGWTKTIRPRASYTNKLKSSQMAALGLTGDPHAYEEDHLISLEIGGHPTDPNNLWPEPWDGPFGARRKDVLETKLKRLVCAGKLPLVDAQIAILTNWMAAYRKYVGPLPRMAR